MTIDVQFLSFRPMLGYGTTEIRCRQPAQFLAEEGLDAGAAALVDAATVRARMIVLHRVRYDGLVADVVKLARRRGSRLVYDMDDLLSQSGSSTELDPEVNDVIRLVDVVTVSGSYLKGVVDKVHSDCRVLRNKLSAKVLDLGAKAIAARDAAKPGVTLGYFSGSAHHDADFRLVTPHLLRLMKEQPRVSLVVGGKIRVDPAFGEFGNRFRFQPFRPYYDFINLLAGIDINLVPLDLSSPFACARSELKYIEAAAFGVPTVAAPIPAFRDAINHRVNGFLCEGEQWFYTLRTLVDDPDLRASTGRAARQHVETAYSPNAGQAEWVGLYRELSQGDVSSRPSPGGDFVGLVKVLGRARVSALRRKLSDLRG
jgi:glycosyltransferase involved in cell wall biosynthesis